MGKFTGRLAKPPIVYALCQIRFPTVGAIDELRADAIHSPLRDRYPHRMAQQIMEFPVLASATVQPSSVRQAWFIYDRPKLSGYVIEPTYFAYRSASYVDFEHFVIEAMRGFSHAIGVVKPALIERVGLRFVDLIESSVSAELEKYLEQPLHGYKPQLDGFTAQANQQLISGKTIQGDLLFRYSRARHQSAIPAELMDPTMGAMRKPNAAQDSVTIDIDHFKDNADMDADPQAIEKLIRELQGPMSTVFKDAVTQFACEQWNTP